MLRPALLLGMGLAAALPAAAQTWTPGVLLGKSSEGHASLSMAASGYAFVGFSYTSTGSGAVGSVSTFQLFPGGTWATAAGGGIPSSYDAYLPGVGQDYIGNALTLANAGQFDNFNNAVMVCGEAAGILGNSCGTAATNEINRSRPIVHFYGNNTSAPNPAVYTLTVGSCNLEVVGTATGLETTLNRAGECARAADIALNASGAGVAGFVSSTGVVAVANRSTAGTVPTWSPTSTLYTPPAGARIGSIAVAMTGPGEGVAIWQVTPKRAKYGQIWAASMNAAGTWAPPTEVASTGCGLSVAAAAPPGGEAAVAFGQHQTSGCELTVALRPQGSGFGLPMTWTSGAHVGEIAGAGTAGGNFVFAFGDATRKNTYAVVDADGTIGNAVALGPAGSPSVAAGGGAVAAVWCTTTSCYGSSLALP